MLSKVSYVGKKKQRHFKFAYFSFFRTHLELKRKIRSYTPVVPSKTIPDSRPKRAKCIFVFRPKRRKSPTLWGGTFVAYIREYPRFPPRITSWNGRVHPTSGWSLRMTECQPTEILPFAPHTYRAYAYTPPPPLLPPSIPVNIVEQGYCIKPSESYNQGRHLTFGNSKTFG